MNNPTPRLNYIYLTFQRFIFLRHDMEFVLRRDNKQKYILPQNKLDKITSLTDLLESFYGATNMSSKVSSEVIPKLFDLRKHLRDREDFTSAQSAPGYGKPWKQS